MPLWAAILLGLPVVGGTVGVILSARDGSTSFLQAPLFVVFIYIWLIVFLNKTTIRVNPSGVRVLNGPLPSGFVRDAYVPRAEVSRILVRAQAGPKGSTEYAAAVERQPGSARVDLLGGFWYQREAQNIAEEVARLWAWPYPVALDRGIPIDRRAGWIVVGWAVVILICLVWGVIVEIYRL